MSIPKVYIWFYAHDGYFESVSVASIAMSKEEAIENILTNGKFTSDFLKEHTQKALLTQEPDVIDVEQLDQVIVSETWR